MPLCGLSTDSDRLNEDGIGVRTVVEVDIPETEGEGHRLRTDAEEEEEEEEDDKYLEVTSRDLGRRAAAPWSGSEGKRGGLIEF